MAISLTAIGTAIGGFISSAAGAVGSALVGIGTAAGVGGGGIAAGVAGGAIVAGAGVGLATGIKSLATSAPKAPSFNLPGGGGAEGVISSAQASAIAQQKLFRSGSVFTSTLGDPISSAELSGTRLQ